MATLASGPYIHNTLKTAPEVAPQSTMPPMDRIDYILSLTELRHASLKADEDKIKRYRAWLSEFHKALPFTSYLDNLIFAHETKKRAPHHIGDLAYQTFLHYSKTNPETSQPLVKFGEGFVKFSTENGAIVYTGDAINFVPDIDKEMSWDEAFRMAALALNNPKLLPPHQMFIKGTGSDDEGNLGKERERWMIQSAVLFIAKRHGYTKENNQEIQFAGPVARRPYKEILTNLDKIGEFFIPGSLPLFQESASFVSMATAKHAAAQERSDTKVPDDEFFLPPKPVMEEPVKEDLPETEIINALGARDIMAAAIDRFKNDFQLNRETTFSPGTIRHYEKMISDNESIVNDSDVIGLTLDGRHILRYKFTPNEEEKRAHIPELQFIFVKPQGEATLLEIHGPAGLNGSTRLYRNPEVEYDFGVLINGLINEDQGGEDLDTTADPVKTPSPTFAPTKNPIANIVNEINEQAQAEQAAAEKAREESQPPIISKEEWEQILTENYAYYLEQGSIVDIEGSTNKRILFGAQDRFPETDLEFSYDGERVTVVSQREAPSAEIQPLVPELSPEEAEKKVWLDLIAPKYEQLKKVGFIVTTKDGYEKMNFPVDSQNPQFEILMHQNDGKIEIAVVTDLYEHEKKVAASMAETEQYVQKRDDTEAAADRLAEAKVNKTAREEIEGRAKPVEVVAEQPAAEIVAETTPVAAETKQEEEITPLKLLTAVENDFNTYPSEVESRKEALPNEANGHTLYRVRINDAAYIFIQTPQMEYKIVAAVIGNNQMTHPDYLKILGAEATPAPAVEPQIVAAAPQQPELEPVAIATEQAAVPAAAQAAPVKVDQLTAEYHEIRDMMFISPKQFISRGRDSLMAELNEARFRRSGNRDAGEFTITYDQLLERAQADNLVHIKDDYKTGDAVRISKIATLDLHGDPHDAVLVAMLSAPQDWTNKPVMKAMDEIISLVHPYVNDIPGQSSVSTAKEVWKDFLKEGVVFLSEDKQTITGVAHCLAETDLFRNISSEFNAKAAENPSAKILPMQPRLDENSLAAKMANAASAVQEVDRVQQVIALYKTYDISNNGEAPRLAAE